MAIRFLPLVTGLLPIVAIHLSLAIAIQADVIPPCFPYVDGCASISATGRYPPASFLFKAAMMSQWLLMSLYWMACIGWLRALSDAAGRPRYAGRALGFFGISGALSLILYVTFLGSDVPFYEFMRRFGVYLYFLFTVIAQILNARASLSLASALSLERVAYISRLQLSLALVPFALGALNLILKASLEDADAAENMIEWIFALLMHCYFLLSYGSFRATKFRWQLRTSLDSA